MLNHLKLKPFLQDLKFNPSRGIAILTLGLGLLATTGLMIADRKNALAKEEQLVTESLYRVRSSLEQAFYKRLTLVVSLKAFLQSHQDLDLNSPLEEQLFRKRFEQFTASLDQQVVGILSMQLAPDGIVRYVTNIERNRQAIGHDLLVDDNRREQVLETIKQRGIIVAGPLELIQGGEAIIARQALFTTSSIYTPEKYINQNRVKPDTDWLQEIPSDFWGFATVVIETETLYQEAGLNNLSDRYRYAIRGRHGLGESGEIFWGDASVFDQPLTTVKISFPNGEWLMGVQLVSRISWWRSVLILTLGSGVSAILGYAILAEYARNQAIAARNQVITISQAKSEFLANMSHELRTPLNAILGITEGLKERVFGPVSPQQLNVLQTIEQSGSHLLELINDLLDVTKIESGKMDLDYTSVYIHDLCQSSLRFIETQALKKRIHLETQFPFHLPELLIDERRIRQALINLLNNAVKFTPEGGRITLEVIFPLPNAEELGMKDALQIAIVDTGIGIAPQNQQKIFEPFIQVDSSLNRKYEGTGLGLALVKHIVEEHGGDVSVSSKLNEGSRFTITLHNVISLPVSTNIEDSPQLDLEVDEPKPEISPLIMLAEDNEANIFTILTYLKAQGYRVIVAKDGEEAILLAQSKTPDLILMDISMPKINGLEAMKQIRLNPNLVDIPIIALTALAMSGDHERCLEAGADDYLSKPVKLQKLAHRIQQHLASKCSELIPQNYQL